MKKYSIFKKNLSILIVFVMLLSSISLVMFSQKTKALESKPFAYPPWITHGVSITTMEDEPLKFITGNVDLFMTGAQPSIFDIFYFKEIYSFNNPIKLKLNVFSDIHKGTNSSVDPPYWTGNTFYYKIYGCGVFYTNNKTFSQKAPCECHLTGLSKLECLSEISFDKSPFSLKTQSVVKESSNYAGFFRLQGYEGGDSFDNHLVIINAPKSSGQSIEDIKPGFYVYRVRLQADCFFIGPGGPSQNGCYQHDFYISFGWKIDEKPDDNNDDDDTLLSEDDNDYVPSIYDKKLRIKDNKLLNKLLLFIIKKYEFFKNFYFVYL